MTDTTETTNAANSSPITAECAANKFVLEAMDTWFSQSDGITIPVPFELFHEIRAALLAAPQPQGGALTDEQIKAMARACGLYGAQDAVVSCVRTILAQSAPSAPQQAGDGLTDEQRATINRAAALLEAGDSHFEAGKLRAILAAPAATIKESLNVAAPRRHGETLAAQGKDKDSAVAARHGAASPRQPGEMGAGVPENWKELMSFYDADTPEAMVEAMEKHILQLQATVLKRGGYGQQHVEKKVREG